MNDGMNNPGVVRIVTPDTSNGAVTALTPPQVEALKRCDVLEAGNDESGYYRYYPTQAFPFVTGIGVRAFTNVTLDNSTLTADGFVVDLVKNSMKYEYVVIMTE